MLIGVDVPHHDVCGRNAEELPRGPPSPFTGSGVFKAINNAVELAAGLDTDGDVDQALAAWNDVQLQTVATFGAAAELFERALIFDMPDLAGFDDDAFAAWNSAVWAKVPPPPVRSAPPVPRRHSGRP
jgi:hypothetical protein